MKGGRQLPNLSSVFTLHTCKTCMHAVLSCWRFVDRDSPSLSKVRTAKAALTIALSAWMLGLVLKPVSHRG
eukprot:1159480-Pelagomonas_calceolata.AAC.4